mmetsp:Transcript_83966/g.216104  ORF Transcript_83966/g.216104 Transcript_83966/m.216104 type:complete len:776 (+) Transcript_83966:188-2515(+)
MAKDEDADTGDDRGASKDADTGDERPASKEEATPGSKKRPKAKARGKSKPESKRSSSSIKESYASSASKESAAKGSRQSSKEKQRLGSHETSKSYATSKSSAMQQSSRQGSTAEFSEAETELDFTDLNKVMGQLCARCARSARRARSGAAVALSHEVHEGWGKTTTAQSLGALRRTNRAQMREAVGSSVTQTWAKFFGGGKHKTGGRMTGKQLMAEGGDDGEFGTHKFIIHNPGSIKDFFEVEGEELACGGSAKVFKAKEKATHVDRAVKIISKVAAGRDFNRLLREISIMKTLDHPNIVKLYETFEDDDHLYLILELCEGGDVLDRLLQKKQMAEHHAAIITRTVLMTLNYLHANGVCHRDIKPENVMFKDTHQDIRTSQLRVCDFGFSRKVPGEEEARMNTKVGSLYYMAPEVLEGQGYTEACDTWSVGVMCYMLLGGYPPFAGVTDAETLTEIKGAKFHFHPKTWSRVSKPAKHLIRKLLVADVDKRITIQAALAHQWLEARGVVKVMKMREATVDTLIAFHQYHRLRRSAMLAVAYQLEGPAVRALLELFQAMDLNGDGLLTTTEFMSAVQAIAEVEDEFLEDIMASVDADGSGVIDFTEFLAATLENDMFIKNHAALLRAFRSFDQDDSGGLSKDEVAETLCMEGEEHDEEVTEFFAQVDTNTDGIMDYGEFYAMLQREIEVERYVMSSMDDEIGGDGEKDGGEGGEGDSGSASSWRTKSDEGLSPKSPTGKGSKARVRLETDFSRSSSELASGSASEKKSWSGSESESS